MKQTKPNQVAISESDKIMLEKWAEESGEQYGIFFDVNGKARMEYVSATSQHPWLFKTKAGKPFEWPEA